ncbi:MAG: SsrA-binding protein SmpB [Candidatus Falkowbacteria bacterium]|nr:SsrA-binding protein SmpB [Candidatus Falkowbacteria bacterium]
MSVLALNKRASYDYEFLEKFIAGIVLTGPEVKAAKAGLANLKGAFVVFRDSGGPRPEAYLINSYIGHYRCAAGKESYNPEVPRKLLLRRQEISRLVGKQQEKGLTLVPIRLYTERSLIKLEFAIARGKKSFDKRRAIKDRELKRGLKSIRQSGDIRG